MRVNLGCLLVIGILSGCLLLFYSFSIGNIDFIYVDRLTQIENKNELVLNASVSLLPNISLVSTGKPSERNFTLENEVVITVLTGSGVSKERIPVLYRLFASFDMPANLYVTVVFFNDKVLDKSEFPDVKGIFFHTVTAEKCGDGQTNALCCKVAFSYAWVFNNIKTVKWIMRATDDTFVHIPNLLCYLASLNPSELHYLGERYERPPNYDYMDGGAGWIISSAVLQKISANFEGFIPLSICYDDVHFGNYMVALQIPRVQAHGFHNENFALDDNFLITLINYHSFHADHKTIVHRPITFHMRFGAQAGLMGKSNPAITEDTYHLLKKAIDKLNYLPCA